MRWPWVSRAYHDRAMDGVRNFHQGLTDAADARCREMAVRAEYAEKRFEKLFDAYHALRVSGANAPVVTEPVVIEPPELPPPKVLGAIQFISPVRDKVYDANWAYWEANKERAAQHPDAFALEILNGSTG